MKDEIKEIINQLEIVARKHTIEVCEDGSKIETMPASVVDELRLNNYSSKLLLDYITNLQEELEEEKRIEQASLDTITNLQEEVEDLREDNYAYHQLIKIQNKREYRSKFLKEFQKEFGTNTFPDYDEIYKRYDKLKKENEKLKEIEKEHKNCTRKHWQQKCAEHYANEMIYKSRNEKALNKIQYIIDYGFDYDGLNTVESLKSLIDMLVDYAIKSRNILKGSDG